MNHRWLKPKLRKWERADHKFAIAAVGLMIFLFVAGVANWLLNGNGGLVAAGAATASSTRVTTSR